MSNRKILVIYTGGTIGMMVDPDSKALKPFEFKNIHQQLPMLHLIEADITFQEMLPLIDSSDTNPDFWVRLAKMVGENYDKYDGFVILHGTDTMAYTASALSFLLDNLSKPVILTGAQLPLGVIRTDGRRNILNAIAIAAEYVDDKPVIQEVCIYFQNNLYRGNRTYKDNASRFNAFYSPNYPIIAEVNTTAEFHTNLLHYEAPGAPFRYYTCMDSHVALVKIYPGISVEFMRNVFNTPGLRAVVIETFGVGNAPTSPEFTQILHDAVNRGIVIVNVTQCKGGGGVEMGRYATGKNLADIGITSGRDMTTEAAVTKLMFLLGQYDNPDDVRREVAVSMRGEMTME